MLNTMKRFEAIYFTSLSVVQRAVIYSLAKKIKNDRPVTINKATSDDTLRNFLARGTLLAPIQFPIRAPEASEVPRGTSNKTYTKMVIRTCAAYASLLIRPAKTVINS